MLDPPLGDRVRVGPLKGAATRRGSCTLRSRVRQGNRSVTSPHSVGRRLSRLPGVGNDCCRLESVPAWLTKRVQPMSDSRSSPLADRFGSRQALQVSCFEPEDLSKRPANSLPNRWSFSFQVVCGSDANIVCTATASAGTSLASLISPGRWFPLCRLLLEAVQGHNAFLVKRCSLPPRGLRAYTD